MYRTFHLKFFWMVSTADEFCLVKAVFSLVSVNIHASMKEWFSFFFREKWGNNSLKFNKNFGIFHYFQYEVFSREYSIEFFSLIREIMNFIISEILFETYKYKCNKCLKSKSFFEKGSGISTFIYGFSIGRLR